MIDLNQTPPQFEKSIVENLDEPDQVITMKSLAEVVEQKEKEAAKIDNPFDMKRLIRYLKDTHQLNSKKRATQIYKDEAN